MGNVEPLRKSEDDQLQSTQNAKHEKSAQNVRAISYSVHAPRHVVTTLQNVCCCCIIAVFVRFAGGYTGTVEKDVAGTPSMVHRRGDTLTSSNGSHKISAAWDPAPSHSLRYGIPSYGIAWDAMV